MSGARGSHAGNLITNQAPDSFDKLMELVEGKAPASLFRLVNVDQVSARNGSKRRSLTSAAQSWIDSMARNVATAEQMQRLFDVFRERDVTFKVKVVFCLKKLWETRVFEHFLSSILERSSSEIRAVMDLYHVAVILSFEVPNMTTAPADIFPYGATAQNWVGSNYGAAVEATVRSVLCSYYIRIIHNIFTMNNVSNLHHIKPILSKYNTAHQARVAEAEGGVSKLVDEFIFPLLGHPRAAACALAVFLAVQMLSTKNPRLETFVRNHDFVTPLQETSRHVVFSHSRWACSHLMKMMLSAPNLAEHTLPCFSLWYVDACASGSFDTRNIRFRFPYEFAHSVLREGMERGPPGGKLAEQWASPIRHSFVLRAVVDGIGDSSSPQRELRSLTVLKLLLASKWTSRKDVQALVSYPKFGQMPVKVLLPHPGSDSSDDTADHAHDNRKGLTLSSGGSLRAVAKRGPSFFRKKGSDSQKTLSRKTLTASVDQQALSGLLHVPEKILLRIFMLLPIPDLFNCCSICWKLVAFIDCPANGLWQHAHQRDGGTSMHVPLDERHSKKPEEAMMQWKQQCKIMARGQLPMALFRVAQMRSGAVQLQRHHHTARPEDHALHIDAAQAVNNEIVVTALKLAGTLQRLPMWWPDMEPFVESHWVELLLKLAHCGDSLEVSKAAWRAFYQLLAYHPGMIDRFVERGLLERFLRPLDLKANHVVIFNGLYYLTKLLANEPATGEHRKRIARKDLQTLAQWIRDSNIWPQWHTIYNAYQSDPRAHSFIFPAIASLFSAVHDSFLCKKLKAALFKVPDYKTAICAVRDLARGKSLPPREGGSGNASGSEDGHAPAVRPKPEGLSYDGSEEPSSPGKLATSRHAARTTGKVSEKRGVTASGVKVCFFPSPLCILLIHLQVLRDCGRHGRRCIDIDDGVALIRRNSDPGPEEAASAAPASEKQRRGSATM